MVWIGVHIGDTLTVPEHLFEKIPTDLEDELGVFGGIAAFTIQVVRQSGLTFGEKVVITGHGILKDLTSQIAILSGMQNLELETVRKNNVEIDGVFVCPEGQANVNLLPGLLRNKATLVILTEEPIDVPCELLRQKNLRLAFPPGFRPDRRDIYRPVGYMRWTPKKDLQLSLKLLSDKSLIIKNPEDYWMPRGRSKYV